MGMFDDFDGFAGPGAAGPGGYEAMDLLQPAGAPGGPGACGASSLPGGSLPGVGMMMLGGISPAGGAIWDDMMALGA
ncbi:hypothetical protein MNEG_16532 [Monoraphidium neglectum]|uniref:Uncharacterized protein n=1 Tax=Monoraphidium neglectum TaxID=145388 RepID=A0A0D2ITU8_9CHLO|nr:hypothetical protein MNEG_16532 [Monoraphidium neglectum]KIY91432.1 hypothetical protein MNEG_16532 [Monoraphidium neglectum]|eukprot:XP_013890452.1 hypothetical protein MNEG_16532 [Monoraphidium neglectum]